jgi:hypothetical protein
MKKTRNVLEGEKQYINETQRMVINGKEVKFPF